MRKIIKALLGTISIFLGVLIGELLCCTLFRFSFNENVIFASIAIEAVYISLYTNEKMK